jgi:hypothetical protein
VLTVCSGTVSRSHLFSLGFTLAIPCMARFWLYHKSKEKQIKQFLSAFIKINAKLNENWKEMIAGR